MHAPQADPGLAQEAKVAVGIVNTSFPFGTGLRKDLFWAECLGVAEWREAKGVDTEHSQDAPGVPEINRMV